MILTLSWCGHACFRLKPWIIGSWARNIKFLHERTNLSICVLSKIGRYCVFLMVFHIYAELLWHKQKVTWLWSWSWYCSEDKLPLCVHIQVGSFSHYYLDHFATICRKTNKKQHRNTATTCMRQHNAQIALIIFKSKIR